jgi:hypothetical protein
VIDSLGWAATVVFVASYFCTKGEVLRAVQMVGAVMWVIYGLLMDASPVVAANLLVLSAAAWTTMRPSKLSRTAASGHQSTTRELVPGVKRG